MARDQEGGSPEAQRRPDAIVDSALYPRHFTSYLDQRNTWFFAQPRVRSHFASQSLLYERLLIPTNDFAIVSSLIDWLGEAAFEDALDSGALTFLRRRGVLMYGGNGVGIAELGMQDIPQKPFDWTRKAFWGEPHESIELQLKHRQPSLSQTRREHLLQKALKRSEVVAYSNDCFMKNIVTASYLDVRDTPELRDHVIGFATAAGHKPGNPIDMSRLPGVEPNSFRLVGTLDVSSAPDLVIRVAEANMDLLLAELAGGTDLNIAPGGDVLLKAKLMRAGYSKARLDGFLQLLTLNGLPDIRAGIESGSLAILDLWKVRQSWKGRRFREWLAKADATSAEDLARLYVESLEQRSLMESFPARIIRFGVAAVLGILSPVIGAAAGLADTLFTERYVKGYRPKLLFDQLHKLFPEGGPA